VKPEASRIRAFEPSDVASFDALRAPLAGSVRLPSLALGVAHTEQSLMGYGTQAIEGALGVGPVTLSGRYALRRTVHRGARLICPKLLGFMPTGYGLLFPMRAMVAYCNKVGGEFVGCRLASSIMLLEELRERPIVHAP
jgi:hypothetical protein